jgi:hypothetical protein
MKFPKLHLVCADDELRPTLNCAFVGKEFTFASDAHILVRHKTTEVFKEDFIATLPESGIMIPRKALALICKKATFKIALTDDKKQIQLHQEDGSVITYNLASGNYPDANSIIPDPKNGKAVDKIGINADILLRLAQGMGCDHPVLELQFFDITKAVRVTSKHSDYFDVVGIIMPCMI